MALRTILEYPDPRLRTKAQTVIHFGPDLGRLVEDLFATMYAAAGIGLAATQVDAHQRVIVADVSAERDQPLVLINPEILSREGVARVEEGCLSVPDIFDEVERAARVRVRAQDREGKVFERDFTEILAVCVQHELDHLEGRLFVDYLSDMRRERIRKKLEKDRKEKSARTRQSARARAY